MSSIGRIDIGDIEDYAPHRWRAQPEARWMDPEREAQADAEIRRESRVVASKRDRAAWIAENKARMQHREALRREKAARDAERLSAPRYCEVCGEKLERRLRGKARKLEPVERFLARRFCGWDCRDIDQRRKAAAA
jgi:hypothetical protein